MSEPIQPIAAMPRIVRPELDRAELQTYELDRFYNVQEQRMITPIRYRDDAVEAARPAEPLAVARLLPEPYRAAQTRSEPPRRPDEALVPGPEALRSPDTPLPVTGASAGERSTVAASTAEIGPSQPPVPAEPLPYGGDPARVLALMDAILTGHEFLPVTFQYRQAGDLIPLVPKPAAATPAAQRIAAVYKAF